MIGISYWTNGPRLCPAGGQSENSLRTAEREDDVKFTFRQLEYFAVLSEHQTLNSAAAALHVSESALSHPSLTWKISGGSTLPAKKGQRPVADDPGRPLLCGPGPVAHPGRH